ncbi:MAG: hypothetical protein CL678_05440 [Bdellovibrionaceae bacterium]|nr:hypothetical protein [Pseudobdellovibrionaceae bacterium]|tara:strand:+ start:3475 stop:4566 length:1092 start_codon:yes stop_codon:yes gene_type:complete
MSKNNQPKDAESPFLFDSEVTGINAIPSVTQLLNRKKLEIANTSKQTSEATESQESLSSETKKNEISPPPPPISFEFEDQKAPAPPVPPPFSPSKIPPPPPPTKKSESIDEATNQDFLHQDKEELPPIELGDPTLHELEMTQSQIELKTKTPSPQENESSNEPIDFFSSSGSIEVNSTAETAQNHAQKPLCKPTGASIPEEQELIRWNKEQFQKNNDSLAKAIQNFLDHSVEAVLYLQMAKGLKKEDSPEFSAKAAYFTESKFNLYWRGLHWNPQIVPEIWPPFLKEGCVEFSPPGTKTVPTSSRNIIRQAFGVGTNQWLTLVRVGSVNQCKGVLALISPDSIRSVVENQKEFLNETLKASAA